MMMFRYNDPYHFGELHRSLLTLFRVATFEDWTDVMYINMYGCSRYGYGDDESRPYHHQCNRSLTDYRPNAFAAIYFIAFIFLGSLVLLTLFVGVVTTAMEEAQHSQRNVARGEKKMRIFAMENNIPKETIQHLTKAFKIIDLDDSGETSFDELAISLRECKLLNTNIPEEEGRLQFLRMLQDVNPETTEEDDVDISEFLLWTLNYLAMISGSPRRFTVERGAFIDEKKGTGQLAPFLAQHSLDGPLGTAL